MDHSKVCQWISLGLVIRMSCDVEETIHLTLLETIRKQIGFS